MDMNVGPGWAYYECMICGKTVDSDRVQEHYQRVKEARDELDGAVQVHQQRVERYSRNVKHAPVWREWYTSQQNIDIIRAFAGFLGFVNDIPGTCIRAMLIEME